MESRTRRRTGWGYDLFNSSDGIMVNIRSRVTPDYLPGSFDWDAIWPGTRGTPFADGAVRSVPQETLLVLLCCHGAKHAWSRLVWIADVDRLLRKAGDGFEWREAVGLAERAGAKKLLALGVTVSEAVFQTPLPEEILSDFTAQQGRKSQVGFCVGRLAGRQAQDLSGLEEHLFYLRQRTSPVGRIGYCLTVCFRPSLSDCQAMRLPDALAPLYYLVRPFRLLWKLVRRCFTARRPRSIEKE